MSSRAHATYPLEITDSVLTDYSFPSPLKRQRALRASANRLPVLPEHAIDKTPLHARLPSSHRSLSPSEKRRSRYGRDEFALNPKFLHSTALDATRNTKLCT
jgi:hypothetical protein